MVLVCVSMVHSSSCLHNTLHFLEQVTVVPINRIGAFRLQLNRAVQVSNVTMRKLIQTTSYLLLLEFAEYVRMARWGLGVHHGLSAAQLK